VGWLLDLDHVGTELDEETCTSGTGEITGQVEDGDAFEPTVL
jgi:hypothetical protein